MTLFPRMSSSVLSRPLPVVPFFAADAALLLTALVVAWRTEGELSGGGLLAIVACVALGAVLAVLPYVLNDLREREAAQAARQRELADLVTATTANTTRWGTQWASAATGLEDAAGLASRSIASAERLPAIFQEKTDALAGLLAGAQARTEASVRQEETLSARTAELETALRGSLAEWTRLESGLREKSAVIAASLAEFPAVAGEAREARAQLEASAKAAEARLDEKTRAVPAVMAELDAKLGEWAVQLEQRVAKVSAVAGAELDARTAEARLAGDQAAAALGERITAVSAKLSEIEVKIEGWISALEIRAAMPVVAAAPVAAAPVPAEVPVVADAPSVVKETEVVTICEAVKTEAAEQPQAPAKSETIMDPFLIPDDGYAALADAMDARDRG